MSEQAEPIPVRWEERVLHDPDSRVTLIPCQTQSGNPVALLLDEDETAGLSALLLLAADS